MRDELLKTAQILVDFIKLADRSEWLQAVKRTEKTKVFNLITESGEMDTRDIPPHHAFAGLGKTLYIQYKKVNAQTSSQAHDVYLKTKDLMTSISVLAKSFGLMSKMNKRLQIPNQFMLFQKVAKVLAGHSLALQNQGELIKIYC